MKTTALYRIALLLGLGLVAWSVGPAASAETETRERWFLDMTHGPLRTVEVRSEDGSVATYHYMTIKVTNGTKFDRGWHPLVKAITDTHKTYVAGGHQDGLDAICRRERNRNLVSIGGTAGRLRAGATIETVAIFGSVDPLYDKINIQIFGLVDPTAIYKIEQYGEKSTAGNVVLGADSVIVDSAYWDHNQAILDRLKKAAGDGEMPKPHVEYQEVSENRYWSMNYQRLGDEFRAEDDIITFHGEGWKVFGEPGEDGGPKGLRVISTEG